MFWSREAREKRYAMMPQRPPKRTATAEPQPRAVGVRGYRIRDLAKTEERRREVLNGAARAFAHGGYDGTNMDQIAHECGLAKGHIYHYFRSKEEIFTEIRVDAYSRAVERLTAIAPGADKDPELALRKAISSVIARTFQGKERYDDVERYEPLLGNPVSLSLENRKRIRTLSRRYEQMFGNILRSGMDKGIFVRGDAKLMTFVILRVANSVLSWYRPGGKWKPDWIVEKVTEQLVRSVKA
jgi:AcrR family transcriptional regulator